MYLKTFMKFTLLYSHFCFLFNFWMSLFSGCDADPQMLADYIMVMLKQEMSLQKTTGKSQTAVIDYLSQQLEDFLKDQTKSCIERILHAVNNKAVYLSEGHERKEKVTSGPLENDSIPSQFIKTDEEFAPIYSDTEDAMHGPETIEQDVIMEEEEEGEDDIRHRSPEREYDQVVRSMVEAPETSRLARRGYRERPIGRFRSDEISRERERRRSPPLTSGWHGRHRRYERIEEPRSFSSIELDRRRDYEGSRYPLQHEERYADRSLRRTTVVRVEKIPPEQCDEKTLQAHFSQFGQIEGILADRSRRRAHIVFHSEHSATAAVRSLDAVLHNRFIRVYRAGPEETDRIKMSLADNKISRVSPVEQELTGPRPQIAEFIPKELPAMPPGAFKSDFRQQQRQETLRHLLDIQRQKQELIHKLMQEQKQLIDRLSNETETIGEEDRKDLLQHVDSLSQIILRHRLQMSQMSRQAEKVYAADVSSSPISATEMSTSVEVRGFLSN